MPLIEGLREISVSVWNSNTLSHDDFIGSGRVLLHKVLAEGYDDSSWAIQSRSGNNAGKAQKPAKSAMTSSYAPTAAPMYSPAPPQYASPYMPSKAMEYCAAYPPPTAYPLAGYPPVAEPYQPPVYPPPPSFPPPPQQFPPTTYPPPLAYTR
ncbi:hypothetical protein Cni_G09195 [Canna indica]|uniref:Uncharacterized protein n=1 Tax=Canna indica TaxID=4628 RepID=A0AAQ3K580_9LILI|nr:hypothetical protein Cni_G09195 [Canna indica]